MATVIKKNEFEEMISECIKQVLAESRQQKVSRKVMNEEQLTEYVKAIITEEMQNEGMWDFVKGMGRKVGGDMASGAKAVGSKIGNAAQSVGNAVGNVAKGMGNAVQNVGSKIGNAAQGVGQVMQNGYNNVKNYAQGAMQAGRNASAAADVQKLSGQIDALYQKYAQQLTKSQASSIRSAKSALNKLAAAFSEGTATAEEE